MFDIRKNSIYYDIKINYKDISVDIGLFDKEELKKFWKEIKEDFDRYIDNA